MGRIFEERHEMIALSVVESIGFRSMTGSFALAARLIDEGAHEQGRDVVAAALMGSDLGFNRDDVDDAAHDVCERIDDVIAALAVTAGVKS